ncbi:MAG: UvrD-helicase domain-containing protein [Clostridia bacterium]|nr:UvrD-helicase domain-containing protein [Clostridia bacterium]
MEFSDQKNELIDNETEKKGIEFSDQQKKVIGEGIDNILVSAAAGSGKTTVLVERIIQKIIKGEVTIDRLLVMTFTKAAAANMVSKIGKAFKEKIDSEEDPVVVKRLKDQLNLLPSAYIQSIDSFCSRVIREKGSELEGIDIEAGFPVVSGPELNVIMENAAREAVSSKYLSYNDLESLKKSEFYRLTCMFGDGRNDQALEANLVAVYKNLRSLPNYDEYIEKVIQNRRESDDSGRIIMLSDLIRKTVDYYSLVLISANKALDILPFADIVNETYYSGMEYIIRTIISEAEKVCSFEGSSEEKFEFIKDSLLRIKNLSLDKSGKSSDEFKETVAPCLSIVFFAGSSVSGMSGRAGNYLPKFSSDIFIKHGIDGLLDLQKKRTALLSEFKDLLLRMDSSFGKIKRMSRLIDFPDQEHYALKILSDPTIGKIYREKFSEIYVDEYQDNSSLQDKIVARISNKNVFTVGDVKQSIYKFRYANPGNFIQKSIEYGDKSKGKLIPLNTNFRSTPEILDFVNIVFRQLMSSDATEIEYDESQYLNPPKKVVRGNDIPKVLLVKEVKDKDENPDSLFGSESDDETKVFGREFRGVLSEVKEYLSNPQNKPEDICILTRTNKISRKITAYLNALGIPTICNDSQNIYEDPDIASICALISVLGNEHRDECLVGVMLAGFRFSNFTVNELAEITLFCMNCNKEEDLLHMNLIVKVRAYANQKHPSNLALYNKVNDFLEVLENLRSESMIFEVGELVEKIYAETGILATVKNQNMGDVSKLREFKNWMCSEFSGRSGDLNYISQVLDELKHEISDPAGFEYDLTSENSVRVMTSHKSKGLEYPFVIVTNLSKEIDRVDPRSPDKYIKFDEKVGFICYDYIEDDIIYRIPSFENDMYNDRHHLEVMSEELRLLYVALTRAQKKLSVVLADKISSSDKVLCENSWVRGGEKIGRDSHLSAKRISTELMLALGRLSSAEDLRTELYSMPVPNVKDVSIFNGVDVVVVDETDLDVSYSVPKFEEVEHLKPSLCVSEFDEQGNPKFPPYKFEESITAPAKTSVSELKREEQRLSDTEEVQKVAINLVVPDIRYFENKDSYSTASSKGTLIHNLLHFLDFCSIYSDIKEGQSSDEALKNEIDYLKGQGVIKEKMLPVIESFSNELQAFVSSRVFGRIAEAEMNNRAWFERPMMFSLQVKDTDDDTLAQGVLDVMFMEGDEAVIVDYKTDRIRSDDDAEIKKILEEKHKLQLDLYAASVEASGIKVKEKIIWLVRKGREFVL